MRRVEQVLGGVGCGAGVFAVCLGFQCQVAVSLVFQKLTGYYNVTTLAIDMDEELFESGPFISPLWIGSLMAVSNLTQRGPRQSGEGQDRDARSGTC